MGSIFKTYLVEVVGVGGVFGAQEGDGRKPGKAYDIHIWKRYNESVVVKTRGEEKSGHIPVSH